MALQSSGAISISEIGAELNQGTGQTISLYEAERGTYEAINSASASKPNGVDPHSMSEWYSYDHSASSLVDNDYYWQGDGVNDTLRHSGSNIGYTTSSDFSYTGWFRISETTNAVQQLGSVSTSTPSGNNQIFIMYHSTNNRLMFRYRHGGSFHQKFVRLQDHTSITGVDSNGWKSSNRGNVNSENQCMLTFTYDASNRTAASGLKIYWNGSELTTTNSSSNVSSPSHWTAGAFAIGDLISSATNNSNVFKGDIDQVAFYGKVLSSSEITTLYNSGTPVTGVDASLTTSLLGEYRLENNANNSASTFPNLTNTGGIYQTYA